MTLLWIAAWIVGGLAGIWIIGTLIGKGMPRQHHAQAFVTLRRGRADVFGVVSDVERYPSWAGIRSVTRLPDQEGRAAYRQRFGHIAAVTVVTRNEAPAAFEMAIVDEAKYFMGTWTYELSAEGDGCRVKLSERGIVPKGFARFVMYTFMGPSANIKRQLRNLAKKFGEEAEVTGG